MRAVQIVDLSGPDAVIDLRERQTEAPAVGGLLSARPWQLALKRAVDDFDNGGKDPSPALDVVIREARVRDTLTLWHMLSRVDMAERQRVYERIAQFEPPPSSVSRDQILALDSDALRRWREELAWKW